jgi:hypothetical protein
MLGIVEIARVFRIRQMTFGLGNVDTMYLRPGDKEVWVILAFW